MGRLAEGLARGDDGIVRCFWAGSDPLYLSYHDREWGFPVADDQRLFEKICLEGFQSGLSWLTILRKRENFHKAFKDFDFHTVSGFRARNVERLLKDAGIVRHRGKIEATINNAGRAIDVADEFGSLAAFFWSYEPPESAGELPSESAESRAMAKELKRRGFRFVGPTTAYAFMQAMGIVNDHLPGCAAGAEVDQARAFFKRPSPRTQGS